VGLACNTKDDTEFIHALKQQGLCQVTGRSAWHQTKGSFSLFGVHSAVDDAAKQMRRRYLLSATLLIF